MFGMKRSRRVTGPSVALVLHLSFVVSVPAFSAETGDYDGDGRLSIRDVVHFVDQIGIPLLDRDLAPGSLDGFIAGPGDNLTFLEPTVSTSIWGRWRAPCTNCRTSATC